MSEFLDKARTIEDLFYNNTIVYQDRNLSYFSRYNSSNEYTSKHTSAYLGLIDELTQFKTELQDLSNKKVVISDNNGSCMKLYGSVGIPKKITNIDNIDKIIDIIKKAINTKSVLCNTSRYYQPSQYQDMIKLLGDMKISFEFPGYYTDIEKKKIKKSCFSLKVVSLTDDSIPVTLKEHEPQNKKKKKSLTDKFGEELSIGSLVVYADKDYSGYTSCIVPRIGNITKISSTNTIYCKNIKMSESDHVSETRIKNNQSLFLLSDDIKDKIMISKLTY